MAKPNITRFSSFKTWLANFNLLVDSVGDLSTLNTVAKTSTVDAVNEIDAEKAKLAGDASQSFAVNALTIGGGVTNTGTGAVATLGPELTTNGTFTGSASGWTLGTHWAYGTNNIVLTNSGSSGTVSQNIPVTSGLKYLVSWTQTNSIDQNCHITPSIGSVSGTKCAQGTGASTMSQIITAGATGSLTLTFTVSDITNTGTVTIDDVSVKQITEYAAHETIKHNSSDTRPTEIRHTWNGVNQPVLAIGWHTGYLNTTGYNNSFIGSNAGANNITGSSNSFIGSNAGLSNTTGTYNSFIGAYAGQLNTTGSQNSFMGVSAGYSNTTGAYNSFMGANAGLSNTTGYNNSFMGTGAGYSNTTGYSNTAIGYQAGHASSSNANVDGYNNTFLGFQSVGASSSSSNTITLGNSAITTLRCQVTSITALSDRRDKDNIEPLPNGLDFINTLNPVKFTWNMRDGAKVGVPDCGFIAQDLKAAQENAGAKDWLNLVLEDNPDKLEITPGRLIPVLVKAIQELSAQVELLKTQLEVK